MMRNDNPDIQINIEHTVSTETVEFTLRCRDHLSADVRQFWEEVLAAVLDAVKWEMISSCPSAGTPEAELVEVAQVGDSLMFRCRLSHVPPAGWRVILNLFVANSVCGVPLTEVQVQASSRDRQLAAVPREIASAAYLEVPIQGDYLVQYGGERSDTGNRLIRVVFKEPLSPSAMAVVERGFAAWMCLANGGYPSQGEHPMESACDAVQVNWLGHNIVECFAANFIGDEAAYVAAIRLTHAFHRRLAPVAEIEIE